MRERWGRIREVVVVGILDKLEEEVSRFGVDLVGKPRYKVSMTPINDFGGVDIQDQAFVQVFYVIVVRSSWIINTLLRPNLP